MFSKKKTQTIDWSVEEIDQKKVDSERAESDKQNLVKTQVKLLRSNVISAEDLDEVFSSNIPVEGLENLPYSYKYPLGILAYCIYLIVLIYFTFTGYMNDISTQFISLDGGSGNCSQVANPFSLSILASPQGVWQGQPGFYFSSGTISIDFVDFTTNDQSNFTNFIGLIESRLVYPVTQLSPNQNLATNLLYWMNYAASANINNGLQSVTFAGDPAYVFNRVAMSAVANSPNTSGCFATNVVFSVPTAEFQLSFSVDYLQSNPNCNGPVLVDMSFMYASAPNNADVNFNIDMRSLTTAIALNLNIVQFSNGPPLVEEVQGIGLPIYNISGEIFRLKSYFVTTYASMQPVYCFVSLSNPTEIFFCGLVIDYFFVLPLFNSLGANSSSSPGFCDCVTAAGTSYNCNAFQFLVSAVLFPMNNISSAIEVYQTFLSKYPTNQNSYVPTSTAYYQLNKAAYEYQFDAYQKKPLSAEGAELLCGSFSEGCVMITIQAGDNLNFALSEYYLSLPYGSCNDTFSMSQASWNNLANNPPVNPYQSYYACYDGNQTAFQNAVGIAMGNTSVAMTIFALVVIPLILYWLSVTGFNPPKEEYSKKDKEKAVSELALLLLRARDGKLDGQRDGAAISALAQLSAELCQHSRTFRGHHNQEKTVEWSVEKDGLEMRLSSGALSAQTVYE